uniref:1-acylglycerol-3-phosphate O-acyltransferase n=1 Tax=Prolemur simus TaxID=1328070 RepID=A0A8C9AAR1_PROSS
MDLVGLLKSQFLCHLVFCYVFIASGLIINTIQLFTLVLWPINKQLFRKINCRLSYCISSQLVMLLEWWSGTECTLYTDPQAYAKYGKENAIVILNHKFEIDFLCGWSLAERFGVLGVSQRCIHTCLAHFSGPAPSSAFLLSSIQNFQKNRSVYLMKCS